MRSSASPISGSSLPEGRLHGGLLVVFALLVVASAWHLSVFDHHHSGLNHVSGTWTTLARDLTDGVFYRPLIAPDGYGGTRYMPLYFVLHAGMIRVGLPPIPAGLLLSGLAVAGLMIAVHSFLRGGPGDPGWRVTPAFAIGGAVLALAPAAVLLALTTIRGDGLPAALNLWGVVLAARVVQRRELQERSGGNSPAQVTALLSVSLLFALAFLSKLTALSGLAAVILWLWFGRRERRAAGGLLLLTVALIAAGLGITQLASQGRFLESLQACASGEPWRFAGILHLGERAFAADPVGVMIIALAGAFGFASRPRLRDDLPLLLFLTTAVVTLGLSLSPGTDWNHLIDLEVAALVLLVSRLGADRVPRRAGHALLAMIALLAVAQIATVGTYGFHRGRDPRRESAIAAVRELGRDDQPLLVENSMLAVEAGYRPFVLDPFALRLLRSRRPDIDRDFRKRLAERQWAAVVLMRDPEAAGDPWYETGHLGPGFREALLQTYRRSESHPDLIVYLPQDGP